MLEECIIIEVDALKLQPATTVHVYELPKEGQS